MQQLLLAPDGQVTARDGGTLEGAGAEVEVFLVVRKRGEGAVGELVHVGKIGQPAAAGARVGKQSEVAALAR